MSKLIFPYLLKLKKMERTTKGAENFVERFHREDPDPSIPPDEVPPPKIPPEREPPPFFAE